MRGYIFITRLRYRWRYVAVTAAPLALATVGYFAVAPWFMLIGAAIAVAGVWGVATSHNRWLHKVTMATINATDFDSSDRLEAEGSWEEARLALAINRLAHTAVSAEGRNESVTRYHETILDAITDGVLVVDDQGGLAYSNSAAQSMFGLSGSGNDNTVTQPTSKVNAFEVADVAATCLATASFQRVDIQLFNPTRHLVLSAAPISVQGSNERRALLIVRDTTLEHRQAESLTEFIANASHELRTPITVIQTSVETLKHGEKFDGIESEFLDNIDAGAKKMARLVAELMELTMIETRQTVLNMAPVAVNDVIHATYAELRPVARKRGVLLQTDISQESPYVSADFDKLQRAASNLVANAIKFTSPGDKVLIGTELVGPDVAIHVSDEGRGIDPEDLPHIFERFFRKYPEPDEDQGFGLGLAIVKNIVEQHDGTVSVDSSLTVGSKFTITLPASASPTDINER